MSKREVQWEMLETDLLLIEEWAVEQHEKSGQTILARKAATWNVCMALRELRDKHDIKTIVEPLGFGQSPEQRLKWVADALNGDDPMSEQGAADPLVQQVEALRDALLASEDLRNVLAALEARGIESTDEGSWWVAAEPDGIVCESLIEALDAFASLEYYEGVYAANERVSERMHQIADELRTLKVT